MRVKINDPRLISPQCTSLTPVQIVHENRWFVLRNRGGYFTIEYKRPQVVILPIVENHSVVMVRVKRPVIADNPLELPAGGARENESPVEAAARELAEETGIEIEDLKRFEMLPPVATSPNRYPVLPYIYQGHIVREEYESRKHHDSEVVGIECIGFEEVRTMIALGEIYVSLPIAIISRFLFAR